MIIMSAGDSKRYVKWCVRGLLFRIKYNAGGESSGDGGKDR